MTERELFTKVRELDDPLERRAFLADACAEDAALFERILRLLAIDSAPDSVLDVPAVGLEVPPHREDNLGRDGPESFPFLEPTNRADSLGRIGQYEVLEVLGRGGFGIVFRSMDVLLNRMVAVKVLAPEYAVTSAARKRFLREATLFALVRHENIVQIYGIGELPIVHLVMEYIPGETLQQRLERTGPLPVSEVLEIGRQIAEGLAAAHATGLIHRDIKPANVLLSAGPDIRVKLTDFGLARAVDDASNTQSGTVAGTPMYMSPEQSKSERLDYRSDQFSLGSVLYTIVCGHPPFRASNTPAVLKRVADDTPRPIGDIIPEVPGWFCAIVSRLHAKNPSGRFSSARELADSLAECQRNPPRPRRPFPLRMAAAAVVVVLSVAGIGIALSSGLSRERTQVPDSVRPDGTASGPSVAEPLQALLGGDPDRIAAEWAMSTGTWARIHGMVNDREFLAGDPSGIPQEPFRLTLINMNRNRKATDETLVVLKGLRHLTDLQLTNIAVTDAVVPYFIRCERLRWLQLYNTRISDESLPLLARLTELKTLSLKKTNVTEAGVRTLSQALPNCTIEWDGPTFHPR
jgi:eukaryotic-like serine/threonine-protein kinase